MSETGSLTGAESLDDTQHICIARARHGEGLRYDLMLASLWAARPASPGFLIHDGTLFDGVDERQRADALELAASESRAHGFQYICTLNSDYVPRNEFSSGFRIEDYIRLRLTDADVAGCVMRVRF